MDGITDLEGLSGLTSADFLDVYENDFLTDVSSLSNLTDVRSVRFSGNDALTNVDGLTGITNAFKIEIGEHDLLQNVDGLSNLRTVEYLWIYNNYELVSLLGLAKLQSATSISLGGNRALRSLRGLSAPSVRTTFDITGNDSLSHLDDLIGFTEIQGNVVIRSNHALQNLDGLRNLASVGGRLDVYDNDRLANCEGLAGLLGWPSGPPQDSVGYTITIRDNAPGCNSVDEILGSATPNQFTVTPSVLGDGGSIQPNSPQQVTEGQSLTFTLLTEPNYEISEVSGTCGGELVGSDYVTSPISGDCNVTASFKLMPGTSPPGKPALTLVTADESSALLEIIRKTGL